MLRLVSGVLFAALASVLFCGCSPADVPAPPGNIAPQVLPGEWQVVGEGIVFTFDDRGVPVSIRNDADPADFRTNVMFGEPATLAAPIGQIDVVFRPGEPFIDEQTGEARFSAEATGSHVVFLGLPVPGSGHATYRFSGQYDAATGELSGQSQVEVYYGLLLIYSDTVDEYVLRKVQPPAE